MLLGCPENGIGKHLLYFQSCFIKNVVTLNEHESVNNLHFKVVCTVFLTSRFLGPKYKYLTARYFYVCFIYCACLL